MALGIKWSKRADKKFDDILDYLLTEWGDRATKSFVKRVYDFLDILSEYPEIGSIEIKEKGIRGFTIIKQVNVFYRIKGETIILLDFFDNRQNPKKKRF
jgi:plasmid stabilization system protein ParE